MTSSTRVLLAYLKGWDGPEATQFYDEVSNNGIEPEKAAMVLDTAEKYGLAKTAAEMSPDEKARDLVNKGYALSLGEARRYVMKPDGYERILKIREKSQPKTLKVFLDDERQTPPGWTRVYWPEEAINLLKHGNVAEISLDHDLGDDTRGTGYDVIKWLEEAVATSDFDPPVIHVHTDNASARQKMLLGVKSIERFKDNRTPNP